MSHSSKLWSQLASSSAMACSRCSQHSKHCKAFHYWIIDSLDQQAKTILERSGVCSLKACLSKQQTYNPITNLFVISALVSFCNTYIQVILSLGTGQRPQTWADDQRCWAAEATNQLDGLTLIPDYFEICEPTSSCLSVGQICSNWTISLNIWV